MNAHSEIDQLIDSIKRVTVREAATKQALERVRRSLVQDVPVHSAKQTSPAPAAPHRTRARWLASLATSLTVAAAVLLLVSLTWRGGTSTALAATMQALERTRNATALLTTVNALARPDSEERIFFASDGSFRIVQSDESYIVHDFAESETLMVDPDSREAILLKFVPDVPRVNLYEELRRIHRSGKAREMEAEQIGAVMARKFRVDMANEEMPGAETTVWIDPDSNLPVQIHFSRTSEAGRAEQQTLREIRFDSEVDPSTFSTELPGGYTLVKPPIREAVERQLSDNAPLTTD